MKLGCCLNLLATTETKIGDENARHFSELAYDYLELPLAQVMDLTDANFLRMYGQIKELGIPVEACNNFFPASVRLTGGNANLARSLEYARRAADRAARMGAQIIVFGSSAAKNIPEGFPYERAMEQLVELLCGIQGIVEPLGITVAIEPLNSAESNIILNGEEGLELMEAVSCANIRMLLDYYHMRMENESLDVIARIGKDLRHVHIAAKEGRKLPVKMTARIIWLSSPPLKPPDMTPESA